VAGDDPGQPLLHAVVQRQPSFGGQLQHHGGDEGLGDAADVHPVLRLHGLAGGLVREAGHYVRDVRPAPGHDDHAGLAVSHQLVGGPLQPGRRPAGNRPHGNRLAGNWPTGNRPPGRSPRRGRARRQPRGRQERRGQHPGLLAAAGLLTAVTATAVAGAIGGLLLVGFAIAPVVPTTLSLAARSAPGRSGQAVATTTAAGYGAFIVSPLTIGLLAQATSLRLALALLVVTSLAIAGLATRWPTASIPPG
jgi:MFS family permease